jgi:hypothetical protein
MSYLHNPFFIIILIFVAVIFVNHASINIYDLEEVRFCLLHPNEEEEKEKVCSFVHLETFNLIQGSCFSYKCLYICHPQLRRRYY